MTEGESSAMSISLLCVGNESVPIITINYTINLSFKTAIGISAISNHNGFRVLFDKNCFRIFYFRNTLIL